MSEKLFTPKRVSVVIPSFNHEPYLPGALESVIRQSYSDYEIVLIDDASLDQSAHVIREFLACHPQIPHTFRQHEFNQGGVHTLNELIELAAGEYVALLNSDDLWMPDKLRQQVEYLDAHPEVGAVFTQAVIIDDNGQVVNNSVDFPHHIFIQQNRSRGKWLRRLFYELNCLCHPSILIRKSVYRQLGSYDPRFRQLPDMQMWVRLLKHTGIHIIEEPLVQLRFHKSNTSKISIETSKRNLNEVSLILETFFDGMSDSVLIDGFGDLFRNSKATTESEIACEKAFLFFTLRSVLASLYSNIGLKQLYYLLGQSDTREILSKQYTFGDNEFIALSGQFFFDEKLISFTNVLGNAAGSEMEKTSWSYVLEVNKNVLILLLRKCPVVYLPLLNIWGWLKGRKR